MISTWRERRAMRRATKKNTGMVLPEVTIPLHFRCPISLDLMRDPVTLSTGITYDRESIEAWIEAGNFTCPVTNQVLINNNGAEQIPNHTIRRMIQDWCVENRSNGIERIPTPRIPVSAIVVTEMLSSVTEAAQRRDQRACSEVMERMKNLMKESERNKRCVVSNGAAGVLSAAFESLASSSLSSGGYSSFEKQSRVLEEILAMLTHMLPLDSVSKCYLASQTSLRCMAWFLKCGNISARRNAVLAIKEVSSDPRHVNSVAEVAEFVVEPLFKLIKSPICPTATKASLMAVYFLISSSSSCKEELRSRFAEMGLVSLLIEMIVDSEKSVCQRALGVLDDIFGSKDGVERAYENALTIPVLVKKLLRVSDLATEFAVSALWKLCKNEKMSEEGGLFVEILRVGAFQKLLLLLQVGCAEKTKEKATEMLKMLNVYRNRSECIESADFKELERPF